MYNDTFFQENNATGFFPKNLIEIVNDTGKKQTFVLQRGHK